jgi:carboxyl-terminal processing protease
MKKTYSLIKSSFYKKTNDETLIKGAVAKMKKSLPDIPEMEKYEWYNFELLYLNISAKHPNLSGKLAEDALDGMVESLKDPYSVLITPAKKQLLENDDGAGAGIEMGYRNGKVVVIAPVLDSPAEKAGIKSGDAIIAINGKSTVYLNLYETATLIKGGRGEKISFTVLRDGKKMNFSLNLAPFKIEPIRYAILSNNIGYIKIGMFTGKIFDEFNHVLSTMKNLKVKGLIIDLRNNPGGDLSECLRIAARFVPDSELVWVRKEGKEIQSRKSASGESFPAPVAILINEGSASASEVLAGAISENGRAVLIGKRTFGKGVIQTQYKMVGGAQLNLTTESYLTPKKNDINGVGIKPDIQLKDCTVKANPGKDPSVIAAWKFLKEKGTAKNLF